MSIEVQIIIQLLLAVVLGAVVGFEREFFKKSVGLKTYSLVCMAAALFTIVSAEFFKSFSSKAGITFDPSIIIGAIILGYSFIGAALIVYRKFRVEGITTAVGLLVVSGIGVAVGINMYAVAVFSAFLALAVLTVFRMLEESVLKTRTPQ